MLHELEQLTEMMVDASKGYLQIVYHLIYRLIEDCTLAVFDESLMEYQPGHRAKAEAERANEPIPVTYIPRKPHPNGLLAYILSSYLPHPIKLDRKLPFIIDYLPHLRVNDIHPGNCLEKIIHRYKKLNLIDQQMALGFSSTSCVRCCVWIPERYGSCV
jgi:hypothetical protein